MRSLFIPFLAAAGVLAGVPAGAQLYGHWEDLPPMAVPRQEVGAAVVDGKLYVAGGLGLGPSLVAMSSMEVFDFATDTWSFGAPMPEALDHHMLVAVDGLIYVLGGFNRDGGITTVRNSVYVYDPLLNSWSTAAPMPQPRGGAWAAAVGRKIYCVGGVPGGGPASTSLFIYDVDTDSWSSGAPMPTPREHLNVVTDGIDIYALGGRAGASTNANERYVVADDRWESLAPLPTARAAMGCAYLDGRIYAAGGETPQLHTVHEVYDIGSNTWLHYPPMPHPRHGVAAVIYDGAMVLAGGGEVQGLGATGSTDRFVPPPVGLPAPGAGISLVALLLTFLGWRQWRARFSMGGRRG